MHPDSTIPGGGSFEQVLERVVSNVNPKRDIIYLEGHSKVSSEGLRLAQKK